MLRNFAYATFAAGTLAMTGPVLAQEAPPEDISQAVSAAETAGVLETLMSGGEVTVFVPTNDALAAAPQDQLTEITGDPDMLASVIQGYAVEGTVMAADVMSMAEAGPADVDTMGGGTLQISVEDGNVMVKGKGDTMATVTQPDLQFGNITIHVIDAAILPNDAM